MFISKWRREEEKKTFTNRCLNITLIRDYFLHGRCLCVFFGFSLVLAILELRDCLKVFFHVFLTIGKDNGYGILNYMWTLNTFWLLRCQRLHMFNVASAGDPLAPVLANLFYVLKKKCDTSPESQSKVVNKYSFGWSYGWVFINVLTMNLTIVIM